jgi:tRNA(Met) cytidine acetyltransferase
MAPRETLEVGPDSDGGSARLPLPHRRLLLLDGPRDWALEACTAIIRRLSPLRPVWISNAAMPGAIAPAQAQQLLGGECDLLTIDAWSGFDADALAAAAGTLRGGGLMLLLAPPLAHWQRWVDPEVARIATHPFTANQVGTRFLLRLARVLEADPSVLRPARGIEIGPEQFATRALGGVSTALQASGDPNRPAHPVTQDQARAVDAILDTARGRAHRPLVISSDRGRGKSAALGIAAGRLISAEETHTVIITAPRRSAVSAVIEHARAVLDPGGVAPKAREMPRFVAPDALARETPAADLLLVDEAAGIPAPLLEKLLERYQRICFATTVHGYEGTGRGFDLRFRPVLERRAPGWRAVRLDTPIRWSADDPLERLIDQALLLDAEPVPDEAVLPIESTSVRFDQLDRDRLAQDDALLRQIFGLLMLGHYQTRPNDLRHLLDGPNLGVAVLRAGTDVLATALVADEGAIEPGLHRAIFDGRRRPRGHLLPQTLSAHAGLIDAPGLRFRRIVRIAVHPRARRQGLGSRLLDELAELARQHGIDLLGASFGATSDLLAFWTQAGLRMLHLGTHRNAASGARAAVVLRPLSSAGSALCEQAATRLRQDLPVLLCGPLRAVDPDIVGPLLMAAGGPEVPLAAGDRQILEAFSQAHRTLEATLPALSRLLWSQLTGPRRKPPSLAPLQRHLLIRCVLQGQPPECLASELQLAGRNAVIKHLRTAVGNLCVVR